MIFIFEKGRNHLPKPHVVPDSLPKTHSFWSSSDGLAGCSGRDRMTLSCSRRAGSEMGLRLGAGIKSALSGDTAELGPCGGFED
jgi:hypothetical protein